MSIRNLRVLALWLPALWLPAAVPLAAQTPELRGVWVTNVASQVLNSKPGIAAAMDSLKAAGLNAIFPVMYNNGYTLYPSLVMLGVTGELIDPAFQGRDVLAELLAEAHRVGLEVHPWFEYGFAASFGNNGGPILARNPGWAGKRLSTGGATDDEAIGGGFYWLSQAHPEVREFLLSLMLEVVENYDIDGVQLDRIRYGRVHFGRNPNNQILPSDFGYDDAHLARYRAEHNGADPPANPDDENWRRWRAGLLNEFTAAFCDTVKKINPHVLVSNAPVVYPYGYVYFMQDWPAAVRQGRPDFVVPQIYRFDLVSYTSELNNTKSRLPAGYDGFFAGMLIRSGSYQAPANLVVSFVEQNRRSAVAGGVFFFYEGMPPIARALHQQVFQQPVSPPFRRGLWRPPATIIAETAATVERTGSWTLLSGRGDSSYFSFDNRILTARGSSGAALRYSAEITTAAHYDVYLYQPYGPQLAREVTVRLLDGSGTQIKLNETNAVTRGWTLVGTSFLATGLQAVAELTTAGVPATQTVAADGLMLVLNRQLSPEVVVTAVVDQPAPAVPSAFALWQNYPNPFNPATTIAFAVPRRSLLRLEVFDLQGRRVAVAAAGDYPAGVHQVTFNAGQLAAGVYFYRLSASGWVATRKLVLMP
ncbi:MAG: family 10 glycosylhydrolase [candidate division KSB1 bacterium]|nr:family 10 glycosylhydrolase [candidate division KSB1 bacterium]MDZ7276352.1 family 10 glycosylhydrolase [candidate division KSB1 bacterium]MDZ7287696.1 family 10 glycosylhydrolase [candidate division KSB1 bacterium]MDZ7299964.1 family 10 glycosylhydrolase [candidate division KSB1 bacterium]MDZ7305707.1 family 10 glycosylhydrolase [candidate division KSB1 bacterium]